MEDTPKAPLSREEHIEQMLSEIADSLHRIDRRDRTRMIWGTIRSLINLIPMLLLLWSTYYLFVHGPELISFITQQTVQQMTGGSGAAGNAAANNNIMQELMKQLQGVKVK